jgi:O-antigen/teichoic acid export membrane protein
MNKIKNLWNITYLSSMIELYSVAGLSVISFFIINFLFNPNEVGSVAIILAFIAIGQIFSEGGFQSYIIYKNYSIKEYSTLFWASFFLSIISSIFIGFIYFLYLDKFQLFHTVFIVITIVLSGLNSIPIADFIKKNSYKTLFYINSISAFLGIAALLFFIFLGCGVDSILYQFILALLFQTICIQVNSRIKPIFVFCSKSFYEAFSYSKFIFFQGIQERVVQRISYPVFASFGVQFAGYLFNSDKLYNILIKKFTSSISRVYYTKISSLSNSNKVNFFYSQFEKYNNNLYLVLILSHFIVFIFFIILPENWDTSGTYISVLLIEVWSFTILNLSISFLNSLGLTKTTLRITTFRNLIILVGLIISWIVYKPIIFIVFWSVSSILTTVYVYKYILKNTIYIKIRNIFYRAFYKMFLVHTMLVVSYLFNDFFYLILIILLFIYERKRISVLFTKFSKHS